MNKKCQSCRWNGEYIKNKPCVSCCHQERESFFESDGKTLTAQEIAEKIEPSENTFDYGCECAEKGIESGRLGRDLEYKPLVYELIGFIERLRGLGFKKPADDLFNLIGKIPPLTKNE